MGAAIDAYKAKAVANPGTCGCCGRRLPKDAPPSQWCCRRLQCQKKRATAYQQDHRPASGLVKVLAVRPVEGVPGRRLLELADGHRVEVPASRATRTAIHCPVCPVD